MQVLEHIRVVLVEPTHPGNIGAAARAMANFGLRRLCLVEPQDFPSAVAEARAAAGAQILHAAEVYPSLDAAIADCAFVVGTSARARSIEWPLLSPRAAMAELFAQIQPQADQAQQSAAVVFGRESRGLHNTELERCQRLVRIPVDAACTSLNLGAAVAVLLYELRQQALTPPPHANSELLATAEQIQHFYAHLRDFLHRIEFGDQRSSKLHRKLARLFSRTQLYAQEVRMLRGIFSAVEKKLGSG